MKRKRRHEIYEVAFCRNHADPARPGGGCNAIVGECAEPPCVGTVVDAIEYDATDQADDFELKRLMDYNQRTGKFACSRSVWIP